MKKFLAIAFAFTFISLNSCALFKAGDHDHVFNGEWKTTGESHYKICTVDGCKEQSEKEPHDYANGKCKVCGYKQQTISGHN